MHTTTEKEALYSKARDAKSDFRNGVHNVKDDIRATASHVKEDLENLAYQAGASAREFVGATQHNVTDAAESVMNKINDKPFQSTAIALGVGFVLGLLLVRR